MVLSYKYESTIEKALNFYSSKLKELKTAWQLN